MSNLRQTIIQTIMTKPFLTAQQLDQIIAPLNTERDQFIITTNQALEPLGLTLRSVTSDYDSAVYYGICQIYEDINGKESLGIKAEIVQLYYKFLELLINGQNENDEAITVGRLLDLAPDNISQSVAQEGLNQLKSFGYLDIVHDSVRIGPRGLLEFRPKFSQKTVDAVDGGIRSCCICYDFILAGLKCSRCSCCIHKHCMESYARGRADPPCPQCQCTEAFHPFGM